MAPEHHMTDEVTVTPQEAAGGVDALGRPIVAPGLPRTYRGRLAVNATPDYQPAVDGRVTVLYRLILPADAKVEPDALVTFAGRTFTPVDAVTTPRTPLTGLSYAVVTIRETT